MSGQIHRKGFQVCPDEAILDYVSSQLLAPQKLEFDLYNNGSFHELVENDRPGERCPE